MISGSARVADHLCRALDLLRRWYGARDLVNPLGKEIRRIVVAFGLHVLGQADGHGPGFRLIGEDPHRLRQAGQELLRAD